MSSVQTCALPVFSLMCCTLAVTWMRQLCDMSCEEQMSHAEPDMHMHTHMHTHTHTHSHTHTHTHTHTHSDISRLTDHSQMSGAEIICPSRKLTDIYEAAFDAVFICSVSLLLNISVFWIVVLSDKTSYLKTSPWALRNGHFVTIVLHFADSMII